MGNNQTHGTGKRGTRANVSRILGAMIEREERHTLDVRTGEIETYVCCGGVVRESMTAAERTEGKVCRRCV